MKKFITLLFVMFTVIGLTSCFADTDTLEWKTLPKSVYQQNEDVSDFAISVVIRINNTEYTLKLAKDLFGDDFTYTPLELDSEGQKVMVIRYKSLTINWTYQVGPSEVDTEVEPNTSWYVGEGPYTINTINDLYGLAQLVNRVNEPVKFDGKTVKLGADIDLSGKVWTPIGAAPRKNNIHLDVPTLGAHPNPQVLNKMYFIDKQLYFTVLSKGNIVPKLVAENEDALLALLDDQKLIKGKYYIGEYVFAEKVATVTSGKTVTLNGLNYDFYFSEDELVGNFFEGIFDGQGHKIIGLSDVGYTPTVVLTYANSGSIVNGYTFGLFGIVKGNVTIKNIIFDDVQIIGAYYSGGLVETAELDSIGAAVGYTFGAGNIIFDNVKVLSGTISATHGAGGVAGRVYTYGNVLVQNCENHANITITEKHAGGIIGYTSSGVKYTFLNNINYGNMVAPKTRAGAMVAYIGVKNTENSITNCRNFGKIIGCSVLTGPGKGMVGMYGGEEYQQFNGCVNYGDVSN